MPVTDIAGKQLRLEASFVPFVLADKLPTQRAEVYVNDRKVAEWSVAKPGQFMANIPSDIVSNGIANIRFDLPDATSPVAMGLNSDANIFALQVVSLTLRSDP